MEKPLQPKQLELSDAISILKLDGDNFSHSKAIYYLFQYAEYDGLKIHLRTDIAGYDTNKPTTEEYCDFDSRPLVKENISYCKHLNDELFFKGGSYKTGQEQQHLISVSRFQCNDTEYYCVDITGQFIDSIILKEGDFYIDRNDLKDFIDSMVNNDDPVTLKVDKTLQINDSGGALKALAILARESADNSDKFKSGIKVNASAFKDHILKKAKEYDVSLHGLKSIDDKISNILKDLHLKNIPKIK